ncbi:zinc finger MYM-type protein 5-like [Bufo gargarizans]|uniref:zinc finger MYM-type protein 5-like n=1 Tax=Bufo gargarizans TaxID=30331 RepID=UPI001CF4FD09|nr:zinc finger MYM-type protein 5-like [Bufo gargarizans]
MKRNYASGSQKRKKRKEEEDKKKQDSGALLKFLSPQALPKDTSTDEATPSTSSSTSTDASLLSADVSSIAQATPSIASHTVEATASRTEIESAPLRNTEVTSTAQDTTSTVIVADDPAQWPAVLTDSVRCQIVKKGPVQVKNIVFPQNSESPPRRFTN